MYISKLPKLAGLGFASDDTWESDDAAIGVATFPGAIPTPMPNAGGGWGDVNWAAAINTAIGAWTGKNQTEAQIEIAKINAQSRYPQYYNPYAPANPYGSVYSPFSAPQAGYAGGTNYVMWGVVALVVGAGYFMLKD